VDNEEDGNTFPKKNLYNKFIKKNKTPDFNTKAYVKLRPFWNDFVQYNI